MCGEHFTQARLEVGRRLGGCRSARWEVDGRPHQEGSCSSRERGRSDHRGGLGAGMREDLDYLPSAKMEPMRAGQVWI